MRVLIATEKPFAPAAVNGIREIVETAGHELVLLEKYTSRDQLKEALKTVEAVIIRSDIINEEVLEEAANLKIVVRAGAGYDNVDLAACSKRKIVVMNTPGQNSNAVAELAIGMMIYGFRNQFNPGTGAELRGKTLGLCACGNVGNRVRKIAEGFDMNIKIYDPYLDCTEKLATMEELFTQCQIVSLHIPLTNETRKSINYDLVMKMPKGALLCNTARKEVIDEDGLIQAMRERKDLIYVTDIAAASPVFATEFKNRYFTTPKKMGAETAEANINAGLAAANQICGFFKDGCTRFQVNKF